MNLERALGVLELNLELVQTPFEYVLPMVALVQVLLELRVELVQGCHLGQKLFVCLDCVLCLLPVCLFLLKLLDSTPVELLDDFKFADTGLQSRVLLQDVVLVHPVSIHRRARPARRRPRTAKVGQVLGLVGVVEILQAAKDGVHRLPVHVRRARARDG